MIDLSSCPLTHVIVYPSEARVCRTLDYKPQINSPLVIHGFPESIDCDSLSIYPISTETCEVQELTTRRVTLKRSDAHRATEKINKLYDEVKAQESVCASLANEQALIKRMREILQEHVKQELTLTTAPTWSEAMPRAQSKVGALEWVLAWEKENACHLESRELAIGKKATEARVEFTRKLRQLLELLEESLSNNNYRSNDWPMREGLKAMKEGAGKIQSMPESDVTKLASLLQAVETVDVIEARVKLGGNIKDEMIKFQIEYQTTRASWSPSYDVRLTDKPSAPSANVTFYGTVRQSTQEDWCSVPMRLSTLHTHSECEQFDQLPRMEVDFSTKPSPDPSISMRKKKVAAPGGAMGLFGGAMQLMANSESVRHIESQASEHEDEPDGADVILECMEEEPEIGLGENKNETYLIENASVPSDNQEHRVQANEFKINKVRLIKYGVPEKSPNVFILASMVNESFHNLLESHQVYCYLNTLYVGKTSLDKHHIVPNDHFNLSFGQDHSSSLTFISDSSNKEEGWIDKVKNVAHKSTTHLNYKSSTASHCILTYTMPISSSQRIKVKMIKPATLDTREIDESNDREAALKAVELVTLGQRASFKNSTSNHIYEVVPLIGEGRGSATIKHEYTIEWPSDKHLHREFS